MYVHPSNSTRTHRHWTAKAKEPITITLPDGSVKEGTAWVTSPYDIAAGIAQGLADSAVVAKVTPSVLMYFDGSIIGPSIIIGGRLHV